MKPIFVDYASQQKGYRFWDPAKQELIIIRDAEFIDIKQESSSTIQKQRASDAIFLPPLSVMTPSQTVNEQKEGQDVIGVKPIEVAKAQEESNDAEIQEEPQLKRSKRTTCGIMNRYMRKNYFRVNW